jgi:hypothetical protein
MSQYRSPGTSSIYCAVPGWPTPAPNQDHSRSGRTLPVARRGGDGQRDLDGVARVQDAVGDDGVSPSGNGELWPRLSMKIGRPRACMTFEPGDRLPPAALGKEVSGEAAVDEFLHHGVARSATAVATVNVGMKRRPPMGNQPAGGTA